MKKILCLLAFVCSLSIFAQNDTLLFNSFDSAATNGQQQVVAVPTNQLDMSGWGNLTWAGADLKTEIADETSPWYDENLWKTWHKTPYIEAIDTLVGIDTTTYDTIVNVGIRSFSWFNSPGQAASVLLSPPVWLSNGDAKLSWKSMPIQGPRYQDGYKVFVLSGKENTVFNTDPSILSADFTMKEMDNSTVTPSETDSSLSKIMSLNDFVPVTGTDHSLYSLPAPSGSGWIDSSRQHPFMEKFELDLSGYNGYVQVLFYHDSDDDNGIVIDDILVTGTGSVGQHEISSLPLKVFPNPASSEITLSTQDAKQVDRILIYSISGKLVQEIIKGDVFTENITVDVLEFQSGVYFIEMISGEAKYIGKFTKK